MGGPDERVTIHGSDRLAERLDRSQYVAGDGPSLEAVRTGRMAYSPDLAAEARWPRCRHALAATGVGAALSVPLTADGVAGSLNLYHRVSHAFDERARQAAGALAACVAGALSAYRRLAPEPARHPVRPQGSGPEEPAATAGTGAGTGPDGPADPGSSSGSGSRSAGGSEGEGSAGGSEGELAAGSPAHTGESAQDYGAELLEITSDAVFRLDGEGRIVQVNAQAAELIGLSREKLLGQPIERFFDERTRAAVARRLPHRRPGVVEHWQWTLVRPDGSRRQIQDVTIPLGEPGASSGSLTVLHDVTDRERAERLQAQLTQSRRLESERIDSLGQVAAGLAHDVNNSLAVVTGLVEVQATHLQPGSPEAAYAEQILAEVDTAASLLSRILAVNPDEPARPSAETVAPAAFLDEVGPRLRDLLGPRVPLVIRGAKDTPAIRVPRAHLEHVLANLTRNAAEAMRGTGRLTIACTHVLPAGERWGAAADDLGDEPGDYVCLSVTDTGPGMDPATLARACEPFFTTKALGGGHGLGLTSVHGVVRKAGGQLRLHSEPGHGTTVRVYLPAAGTAHPAAEVAHSPARPQRILVVDDQESITDVLTRLLAPAGYDVTTAHSGEEALAHLRDGPAPDLVVTDVMMPGITGPELAARIHADHPGIRVIYISGYTAGALSALGPDAPLINKPFTRDTLLTAIAHALGTPATAPAAGRGG